MSRPALYRAPGGPASDDGGFTIVEMVITMGVLLLVMAAALGMFVTTQRNERGQEVRTRTLDDVRGAVARVTKEVRQALVVQTTSTRSKLDMQTLINTVQHRVVYDVSGTTLRRAVDGGTPISLVTGLTSTNVFCYDHYDPPDPCPASSPATTTPSILSLTVQAQPSMKTAKAVSLTTEVELRNSGT